MALNWVHESPAYWDANKQAIIGGAPEGSFEGIDFKDGAILPGDWWRAEQDGTVVGFGWMDVVWGDGEVMLAVSADTQSGGVGSFIIDSLAKEAETRGLNYIYNRVAATHPNRDDVSAWLKKRGFSEDDEERLRRLVCG